MPELPEVETVMRGLMPALEGKILVNVQQQSPALRVPFPPRFAKRLTGRTVTTLRRRAKYILADLDDGETLIIHLGMTGRMLISAGCGAPRPGKHDHVVFTTDTAQVIFHDPRRFGLMMLVRTDQLVGHPLFAGLGPEPLERSFTPKVLAAALKNKKTPLKAALLDQRVVAGLGNIYVSEALFEAHLRPERLAGTVADCAPLTAAIKKVLKAAIRAGGSTLRDYRHADGSLGYFQHAFKVYDRSGQPCLVCGTPIRRIVQSGRSSYFCPACQK
ncbi:MAG: bifunctional DNA-formamidopyrimidine glycosylase/DNA-(apurinic or apyrimidinic site) lyase [Rhizomicrobium sp.]